MTICNWIKRVWTWVVYILAIIGIIALYVFFSKSKVDEKVKELEKKIAELEEEIKRLKKEREDLLSDAQEHHEQGVVLDAQIEEAKKKQQNLKELRDKIKDMLEKYGK